MRAVLVALTLLAAGSAYAEDVGGQDLTAPPTPPSDQAPAALAGTLLKARSTGTLTLGVRDSAYPFAFTRDGKSLGYSVDLCKGVVAEIARQLQAPVAIAYAPVTASNRFDEIASGRVDIECGSTTENVERRKQAAFSPLIFIAGVKLMTRADSSVRSLRDLSDKTLIVAAGTTSETAMRAMNDKYKLGASITTAASYDDAYDALAQGHGDALAADDILLNGLIAKHHGQGAVQIVGDFLTYEPYGLMFRKDDPQMAAAVTQAFAAMAADGELLATYRAWFLSPTPTGETLGLPMSVQLSEAFRAMGADGF
jgi:glutamate/aspartate transport system substrate-binding protein